MAFSLHIGPNIRKSPFFDATVAAGVRSFSVYNHMYIPGNFGDPDAEYDRIINGVSLWDVGAERQVEIAGPDAAALIQYLSARDISKSKIGQGRYVVLCDPDGWLINDPVLLKLADDRYWLSIADSDVALLAQGIAAAKGMDVKISEPDASPLAIQGPKARPLAQDLLGDWVLELKYFAFREAELNGIPLLVARSGWSKQGGFEFYLLDKTRGTELWDIVAEAGQAYDIGPGAPNDVERIESGLISYGADARHQRNPANPFELGLGKLVGLEREDDFLGKEALKRIAAEGAKRRLAGLIIDGAPVHGNQHPLPVLQNGTQVGTLSELTYSPRLQQTIGIALINRDVPDTATDLTLDIGEDVRTVRITDMPFIQPGG